MVFQKINPGNIWKPESEGDEVIGILLRVENDAGKYKSKVYHLESDGENITVFGSKVLDDLMLIIKPGDLIRIVFKGKVKGKDSEYNSYEVYKDDGN